VPNASSIAEGFVRAGVVRFGICSPLDTPHGLGRGYFLWGFDLASDPPVKRAVAFFDGQNCFNPSFDAAALGRAVCASRGWTLVETRFYTGIPDARDNATWNHFWTAKLAQMGARGRRHLLAFSQVSEPEGQPARWHREHHACRSGKGHRCASGARCGAPGPSWRIRRGPGLEPRPGPERGRHRAADDRKGTGSMVENRLCLPSAPPARPRPPAVV
jgi:hypothetical protein